HSERRGSACTDAAGSGDHAMKEQPMNDTDPHRDETTTASLERETLSLETAGRSAPRGARAFLWLTILVAIAVAIGVLLKAWSREPVPASDSSLEDDQSGITNRLKPPRVERPAPPKTLPPPASEPVPAPAYVLPPPTPAAPPRVDEVAQRRLASPLQAGGADGGSAGTSQANAPSGRYSDARPLTDKLRPLELAPSVAGPLGDRNFLLTQGTMTDCTLQTNLVSNHPGLLTCLATYDVMSTNGKVKL